ncbi:acyl carrier protein [Streptomyces microflavus]|uniref:acyl carrier protein n=1 Tax=Streptomyces microflavus TaxID=1919 RepID=UPI0033BF609D
MITEQSIIEYIATAWLDGDTEGLDTETRLAELGIVDSAGIFDLVHFLQSEFRITVPLHEVAPANFQSVSAITALVDRIRNEREGAR